MQLGITILEIRNNKKPGLHFGLHFLQGSSLAFYVPGSLGIEVRRPEGCILS